ncbi:hypothetical protein FQN50_006006 [Emmonsiellopsis sp. PD_5]|nr:hypothetical protein FQN50_006006 [Emmonsiellopsis sp. PD_5]
MLPVMNAVCLFFPQMFTPPVANYRMIPGQRKLRCSGEAGGCTRCVKQSLYCHYSIQKPMGRPPKSRTQRQDEASATAPESYEYMGNVGMEQPPAYSFPDPAGCLEGATMCPPVYGAHMMSNYDVRPGPFVTNGPIYGDHGSNQGQAQYSPPYQPLPSDYSEISLPTLTSPSPPASLSTPPTTSGSSEYSQQPMPPCSCLSYLYLTLSSLSTLSSFPPSAQSLSTLYTAAKTARSVIYCEICPQAFHSGMQNLMLLGTLLNVIGDGWLRLSQMNAEELGKDTLSSSFFALLPSDPVEREARWKQWLNYVVRHAVLGGTLTPQVDVVQSLCLESPSLVSLIEELEDRQRRFHASPRPFMVDYPMPPGGSHSHMEVDGQGHERDHLCLHIAGTARKVIDRFRFED